MPFFDKLLGPSVYSHRYNYDKLDERYLFRRGIPALGDFIGSVKSALEPGSFLVSTDLTNYYEGVSLVRLKSELLSLLPQMNATAAEKYQIRQVIEDLFRCLANWTFDKERSRGLVCLGIEAPRTLGRANRSVSKIMATTTIEARCNARPTRLAFIVPSSTTTSS